MTTTNALFDGLSEVLVAASVGVTRSSGTFQSTDTAIVMQTLPQAPDNAIALTIYAGTDDPTLSDSVARVQVMCRAKTSDPRPTNDLADAVFAAFQNLTATLSTGIVVQQMLRRSSVPLGKDDQQRWVRSDNYDIKFWNPSTYRE